MKGTAQRGNAAQLAVAVHLEMKDYTVHVAVRAMYHNNDVLGAFDIIAVKLGYPALFIQVTDITNPKSKGNMSHRKKKVIAVPVHTTSPHEMCGEPGLSPGSTVQVWGTMNNTHAEIWTLFRDDEGERYWEKGNKIVELET